MDLQAMSSHVTMIPEGLHPTLLGTTDPRREQSLLLSGPSGSQSSDRALCVPADHPIVEAWEKKILPKLIIFIKDSGLRINHIDVIRLYQPMAGLSPEEQAREEDRAPVVIYVGVDSFLFQNDQVEDELGQAVQRGSANVISTDKDIAGGGIAKQLALSEVGTNRAENFELAQAVQRGSDDATSAAVDLPERAVNRAFTTRITRSSYSSKKPPKSSDHFART